MPNRPTIDIRCQNTACGARVDATGLSSEGEASCPYCGQTISWNALPIDEENTRSSLSTAQPIERCLVCGSDELYVRKDFPQRLGLSLVVVVGLTSCWFFARGDLLWALGVLLAVFVVDLAIYWVVPKLTVCYRCGAEYRGLPTHPDHRGFDLATAEKYRAETSKRRNVETSKPEGNGPSGLS